jgi:nucleotide-binding universal stress UspA family protein
MGRNNNDREERLILVPLDESPFAERALPVAEQLARATGSAVLLVQVTPLLTWAFAVTGGFATSEAYQELLEAEASYALGYLARTAHTLETQGVSVKMMAVRGDPAATLLDITQQSKVDLLVMTTHGRTGLERFALGSIADRLVHAGKAPVLLLRSFAGAERVQRAPKLERALVPLDGSKLAEHALDEVVQLAGSTIRHATLVRVMSHSASPDDMLAARRYLDEKCAWLEARCANRSCTCDVKLVRGKVADALIDMEDECDLIVMATHGRGGMTRWMLGSIADRMVQGSHLPLLLVTPH